MTLIATVETDSQAHAVAAVKAARGEALVAIGVVEQWRAVEAGEAVIATVA